MSGSVQGSGRVLTVDILITAEKGVDCVRCYRLRVPKVSGEQHGAGDVFDHNGCFDGVTGVLADGERAMIFHEYGA